MKTGSRFEERGPRKKTGERLKAQGSRSRQKAKGKRQKAKGKRQKAKNLRTGIMEKAGRGAITEVYPPY
jgi:hypothetical protein